MFVNFIIEIDMMKIATLAIVYNDLNHIP